MSTTAAIITASIVTLVLVRPDVVHHTLNVAEKALDIISKSERGNDEDMNSGNRNGRTRSYY